MDTVQAWTLGLHLLSAHASHGYETATVGVYVESPEGVTVGALRNSERRLSFYASQTWQTADGRWAITAGAITGYRRAPVTPLLVPSLKVPFDHVAVRLSAIPKPRGGSSALHLSVETSF